MDVTDANFTAEVLDRSERQPVVIDLWAPWCGPCKQLGPIIEASVAATDGAVALAKVNVDENPATSQAFQVQSIPAVYAMKDREVVDHFMGARPQADVDAFVAGLSPSDDDLEIDRLVGLGDEASLRGALELDPARVPTVVALAEFLVEAGRSEDALEELARIPETPESRRVAALARTTASGAGDDVTGRLDDLLDRVEGDEGARQEFIDLLDVLGADDPRTADYRKALTARLF
jgi:putative thioredoxin